MRQALQVNGARLAAAAALWTGAPSLVGCAAAPEGAEHAAQLAADAERSAASRRDAMERLLADARQAPARERADRVAQAREALKRIAWRRSEAAGVRLAAIETLAGDDPDDAARMVALMLPTENAWPVIEGVSRLAVELGWGGATTALVRSWSREVAEPADADRPEKAALEALHPEIPIEDVVFHVFLAPEEAGGFADKARADAWELLMRLDPQGAWTAERMAALTPSASDDPLVADLRAAASDLGAIPRTSEQVEWLRAMRRPEHAQRWATAARAVADLDESQRAGLALRHATILAWVTARAPQLLSQPREALLADVESALATRTTVRRTAGHPDALGAPRETIRAWRERLSWGDALALRVALDAVDALVRADDLFKQAREDRRDNSTEHGGVIVWESSAGFTASAYPPRPSQRYGDNRFVASSDMLEAGAWALFHYHFHAQRVMNDEHAGPGAGDLEYAKRQGCACIVFTSVGDRALNADYYQPNGARIDLGVIRPAD